jgi:hypothetical protein
MISSGDKSELFPSPRISSSPIRIEWPVPGFQANRCVTTSKDFTRLLQVLETFRVLIVERLSQDTTEEVVKYLSFRTLCQRPSFIKQCLKVFATNALLNTNKFLTPQPPKEFRFCNVFPIAKMYTLPCPT